MEGISSEIPKGSILDSALFNIFINNVNNGAESLLSKYAADIKLARGELQVPARTGSKFKMIMKNWRNGLKSTR